MEWRKVQVGDIVRVNENQFFPADILMLSSSENQGVFYVETKNLDGETNLKLKGVSKDMLEYFIEDTGYAKLAGTLNIEEPNNRIYKFDGNYDVTDMLNNASDNTALTTADASVTSDRNVNGKTIPLSNANVALRGMSLRNTEHVTGVVVYTGHDSKIQMNSAGATYKVSNIMHITNRQILYVFCI